jgi:hypothetical protein
MIFPSFASAYIDPGAGSMLLQVLLGGFAGIFVVGRLFWRSILAFVKGFFGKFVPPSSTQTSNTPLSFSGPQAASKTASESELSTATAPLHLKEHSDAL